MKTKYLRCCAQVDNVVCRRAHKSTQHVGMLLASSTSIKNTSGEAIVSPHTKILIECFVRIGFFTGKRRFCRRWRLHHLLMQVLRGWCMKVGIPQYSLKMHPHATISSHMDSIDEDIRTCSIHATFSHFVGIEGCRVWCERIHNMRPRKQMLQCDERFEIQLQTSSTASIAQQ